MKTVGRSRHPLRVHLTNVTAPGPSQVVRSLLPALEACDEAQVDEIYLPDRGDLAEYTRLTNGPAPRRYRRFLPALVSRALECTLLAGRFSGATPLLVLGDVPLACQARQVVFVQTVHLAGRIGSADAWAAVRNSLARQLFRLHARRVSTFVVQTEVMRTLLEETYPHSRGKVVVIPQPPPTWLLDSGLRRTGRLTPEATRLELVYPAAEHSHKNHALLARIRPADAAAWPVARLTLTIAARSNPNRHVAWIECTGFLPPEDMVRLYARADAVVYLSRAESYGLPLVEAMYVGLPVVAPDLPFARTLCGNEAIYFDPLRIDSLQTALVELRDRLARGWWPDWSSRLTSIPDGWPAVARHFLEAVVAGTPQH